MFCTIFQLLKQLKRGKHLKLVAAEESIHTLHSSLNVQLLLYIIKSRPICFSKLHTKFLLCVIWASGFATVLHKAENHVMHPRLTH